MGWHADITVGAHSWSIDEDTGEVPDAVNVLDGLTFGWALADALWPAQPAAMTASMGINVPNFADVSDVAEGDPVAIEVTLTSASDGVWASFYGRVTDAQAVPRPGKRHGVTLEVTAVDYTIDIAEGVPADWAGGGGTAADWAIVNAAFVNGCGGALPITGGFGAAPDLWSGPLGLELTPPGLTTPKVAIDAGLLSAVNLNGTNDGPGRRMIVSPLIGSDGLLPATGRQFTLDTIDLSSSQSIAADGDHIARAITWTRVKGDSPTQIVVTFGGGLTWTSTRAGADTPYVTQQVDTWLAFAPSSALQVEAIGTFYLPQDSPWQVKTFDWLLYKLDDATLDALPRMFPNWRGAEGADFSRWTCYAAQVVPTGLDDTCTPDGADGFTSQLIGASLSITGGHITVTPVVRRTGSASSSSPGWILGDPVQSVLGSTTILT